jgi:NAD(P) transhydrogenase
MVMAGVLPMSVHHFDLIVIGSGPAGEKGAAYAAAQGKKVAVIEKESLLGGTVANQGTLPSKTLRESAAYLAGYRQRGIHGMTLTIEEHVSAQEFLYRERLVRQLEQARIRAYLEGNKVTLYHGAASFIDSHTIRVSPASGSGPEQFVTGNTIMICTGAMPYRPPVFSVTHPSIYDSESVLHMSEIPKNLTIVGGGVIGAEYACIFASFGVQVTLLEEHSRMLPFLDNDVAAALMASMRAMGVDIRLGEQVVACRPSGFLAIALKSGSALSTQAILITAGRRGNTAKLDLKAAGLEADELGFLHVNEFYQTAQQNIYAVGDVIGFPALASAAREQATEAMVHAFTPEKDSEQLHFQPYGIYTIPECSMVGATEDSLTREGVPWVSGVAHYAGNARGQIIGARAGFVKLLYHRESMKLLGIHIIGEQASELLHVGLVGLQMGATADLFLKTCFNYPTLGELYKSATLDAISKRTPKTGVPSSLLKPKN